MGWTATAEVLDQGVPAAGPANDNAVPGGRVAWYRNLHRYYDPAVGRYTQVEPLLPVGANIEVNPRDLPPAHRMALEEHVARRSASEPWTPSRLPRQHPYAYVDNDPLTRTDPTGEQWGGAALVNCYSARWPDECCATGEAVYWVCVRFACRGYMYGMSGNVRDEPGCIGWWGNPKPMVYRAGCAATPKGIRV